MVASDAPISGLALLSVEGTIYWCRAARSLTHEVPIKLKVFPYGKSGCDVQVNLTVGAQDGNRRFRTWIEDIEAAFRFMLGSFNTGRPFWFCEVAGRPKLSLGMMFICDDDVATRRNGLWHLRAGRSVADPAVAVMLGRGRTGII
jgi:hypothetical protein